MNHAENKVLRNNNCMITLEALYAYEYKSCIKPRQLFDFYIIT